MSQILSVVSFNAWILRVPWIGGKDVVRRFQALPQGLADTGADILLLQEIWHSRDRDALHRALQPHGYAYAFHRRNNLADGLMVLSKFPGADPRFLQHRYGAKGWERFLQKGTLHVTIDHPELGPIDCVDVHLQAATDSTIRRKQIERIMEWLPDCKHLVMAGDFNFPYRMGAVEHPVYQWFTQEFAMRDAYRAVHGITTNDATYDYRQNPYAVDGDELGAIDYVFYRSPSIQAATAAILFRDPPVLSDHFGVAAGFTTPAET